MVVRQPVIRADGGAVCVANIGVHERRTRLAAGVAQLTISLAVLATLVATGADRWWHLLASPLFWGAAVGFFQWRDGT